MKTTQGAGQANLLDRHHRGPVEFAGGDTTHSERHLTFDQVLPVSLATMRDKFAASAHPIRDVISQRWLKTEQTYRERNAKRVYYLSLEFLMGHALANNITNLMLNPVWGEFCQSHKPDSLGSIDPEPMLLDPILETLPGQGDHHLHLADLRSYGDVPACLGSYCSSQLCAPATADQFLEPGGMAPFVEINEPSEPEPTAGASRQLKR